MNWRTAVWTLAALLIVLPARVRADWDVTNTGEPYTQARFSVTEGTWMNLDVSPDGKTLLFDLLGDIYSLSTEGGEARLVHGGPAMEHSPRFSLDGSKMLYISDKGGSDNLWVSNIDGSAAAPISHETANTLGAPAWSADGQYVVATKFSPSVNKIMAAELWLYHLKGGDGRLLVDAPKNGKAVHEGQLSGDGRYLYYTKNIVTPGPSLVFVDAQQPCYVIERLDLRNGRVEVVVGGFGSATTARVSPNGRLMTFIRRVKDKTVLFVYDIETGEQRPLYDGLDRDQDANWNPRSGTYYPQYAWFPDNRHLAIWAKGKLLKIDVTSSERTVIPFRASVEQRLTVPTRFENALSPTDFTVRAIRQPAQSPDGRTLTFNALGRLWQKSLPGGEVHRLTQSTRFEFEPSYSADGAWIAYVSWDDEQGSKIEIVSTNGRRTRTVISSRGILRQPVFSSDGKRLAYWLDAGIKKMGGYLIRVNEAGLYWTPVTGGEPHRIAADARNPQFSPDGMRVYYTTQAANELGFNSNNALESVDLNGQEKRLHVVSEETSNFRISPDLTALVYQADLQYYLMPYRETGTPIKITKRGREVPVIQLTESGGYEIAWSSDSKRLNWVSGQSYFSASLDRQDWVGVKPVITESLIDLKVPVDKPRGSVAFINGRILTMKGEEVIERGSILVEGNRISAVGPVNDVVIPKGAKVIDVSGKTLMPGFVDMHGHLNSGDDDELMPQKLPSHYAALAFGVTTDFDPSDDELSSYASSEMNLAGVTVGPRLLTSGKIIYGKETLGECCPIRGIDDARRVVARKKALGGIFIKSYFQPMRSQRQQLIKAARELGLMVTPEGESNFYNNISMILDGHVKIEHNFPMPSFYDDVIQLIAHASTAVTPTLIVTNGEAAAENYFYETTRPWEDPKIKSFVQTTVTGFSPLGAAQDAPPYVRGMVALHQSDELWDIGFRSISRSYKKLDDAGGVVTTGSHGEIQGLDLHWEMWALAEGGMSNFRVLRAATFNGAKAIGLDKQIGTLEVGKLADMIVLDANPLDNIRNSNSVHYTVINGRLYDSSTMNEVGNYSRPRSKFYWELEDYHGIDWNNAWGIADVR